MNRPPVPRLGRVAASAAGALVLLLGLAGSAQASERATLRLLGSSPIYASVGVEKAAGGTVQVRPARYHYRITTGTPGVTTEASGNCADLSRFILSGRDYQVDLQSAADAPELGSPSFREAGWLLSQTDGLIAAAPDAGLEAGALQIAVWQLSGQARDIGAPSGDAVLNARAAELRALAAGRSLPSALAVSVAGGPTCLDTPTTVTVTGSPGAVVDLSVPNTPAGAPTAQVMPQRVTLDAGGLATAKVRSSEPGTVTVTAAASAPTLLRATGIAGASGPQDQLFLRPRALSATATHAFIDCALYVFGSDGPATTAPLAPTAPAPATAPATEPPLVIVLDGPGLAAPGGVAVYTLHVTNNGPRTARDVRVAQSFGRGVAPISARGPRARIGPGAAHWTLAALKGGRSATLTLKVRVGRGLAGEVTHTTAAARGAGALSARASATTAILRKVGKAEQGF
jgi:uncharacterized repeat protein (TIGR01451 family)